MRLPSIYIAIFSVFISFSLQAQQGKIARADQKYSSLSYTEAIALYNSLIKDGYGSVSLYENLGNAYYYQSKYDQAGSSYDSLFQRTETVSVNTYYKYIAVLRSQGKYNQAKKWYDKMLGLYPNEKQEKSNSEGVFVSSQSTPTSVTLKNAGINSAYSDYKASYLGADEVVFTSGRATWNLFSKKSTWNNEAYSNLYKSRLIDQDSLGKAEKLKGNINKYYHESSAVFTKDGTTMYFTRNNYQSSRVASDSLNNVLLKIYKATFNGKKWSNVEELPFNSNDFSCAHPALSPNEDYLYFSSDMPGTLGESDLYRVAIKDNNTSYGTPESLGSSINTKGRETFPFISSDNVLVFASDYRAGLGGLDLYYVNLTSKSQRVYRFSAPINTPADDFGLIYKTAQGTGFLTSNRKESGLGTDDIYQFEGLLLPNTQDVTLVFKSNKGTPILGTTSITLKEGNATSLESVVGKNNKLTLLDVDTAKEYNLAVSNANYEPLSTTIGYQGKDTITITLTEKAPPVAPVDLREVLKLDVIYFDFDTAKITKASAVELQKVVAIMQQYPSIAIEIVGHTDRRGPASYNQLLSERRASLTKKWLVENGISSDRMTTKGLGESTPMNDCIAKRKCTEQQHNQNRRTAFIIK
ncbi:OmpA family protein [uncultured Polaribacter sp.]|uniref:OmpA family protein n=1 Tax=uncultured Polaribacter sp. TaxID=174711 RepID=UPI00262C8901|nr:OmpA family protein [uncultured Polaribacter sp.]